MSTNQAIVLGNIPIFYNIVEYLSSKEILNLFLLSKSFTNCLNTTYDKIIYKIYKKLYSPFKFKNKLNFDILMNHTIKLIKMEHVPKYFMNTNIQFITDEIIIREIIYNIVKFQNITSIYYLLYQSGFYELLNRFIVDEIVISPYECTLSNTVRKTLHYYGNEQTLRMAVRFKQHDMIKKILSDMQYISKNRNFDVSWFIRNQNNVLYESIYNDDYVGFKLIAQFIYKINKRRCFILERSDAHIALSDINNYDINYDCFPYIHTEMNDNIAHINKNPLIYTLKKNISKMFNNWIWQYPLNLDSNDFIISENNNFIISERFLEYMSVQHRDIINYFKQNNATSDLNQFRSLVGILNSPNRVDIYSHIDNQEDNIDDGQGYYLLPYLIIDNTFNGNNHIFITLCIIFHYFDNFNIDLIYNRIRDYSHMPRCLNTDFINSFPNTCNILEYITYLIRGVYGSCDNIFMIRNNRFIHQNRFIYFVNLLLIRNILLDSSYKTIFKKKISYYICMSSVNLKGYLHLFFIWSISS